MNFLEQLFQAIAAVPQVQQKGAPNAGSAVPQPVQAAPPVNNPSRLGMFAMMPPQGSAAGGVAPPAPPQRPVARYEPGQAQAVPPVRAPSPPQQGAGPSNGLSLDFQRQLARIPGFESYVDEAALAAADRGAPAPTMRASGPMGVT